MRPVGVVDDPNLEPVQAAAAALGELPESVVLVGGCAAGALSTTNRPRRRFVAGVETTC
ncbi:MAG: hypothetical protein RQ741_03845 [Wenzhouxiangellaceae bacterium]|nr:hypothetical protein [Wenzhouxiangellaceae bacterium]